MIGLLGFLLLCGILWPASGVLAAPERTADALGADLAKGVKESPSDEALKALDDPSFRVELKKTAPAGDSIRVGGAVSFEAKLLTDKGPISPERFVFRWMSDGDARFLDPVGPALNTAVFLRPGRFKVRVGVFLETPEEKRQVAESMSVDLDISNPLFSLSITPTKPLIGEEIKAEVRDFPLHEGVEFRWAPLPRNAKLLRVGEKDVSFYLKDSEPVTVAVTAALPQAGAVLGEVAAKTAARPYKVEVRQLGPAGNKTVVWKDGEGPVETSDIAVHQKVRLRADVEPTPGHPPLSYKWTACPGGRLAEGEASRDAQVFRDGVGACRAGVEIRDNRDIVIGRGETTFDVTVSQAELDKAERNARETLRLTAEAERLWSLGEVDASLGTAQAALALNPKHPETIRAHERVEADARRIRAALKRAEEDLAADAFKRTAESLDEAAKINGQYPAIAALEKRMRARKDVLARIEVLIDEADARWNAGEVAEALGVLDKALALDDLHPKARSERDRMVKGRDRIIAALKQADALVRKKQFESAAAALAEARAVNDKFAPVAEMRRRVEGDKSKAWKVDELLAKAQDLWNGGDVDGALSALGDVLAMEPGHAGAAAALKKMAALKDAAQKGADKASALAEKGRLEEALAVMAKTREINPKYYPLIKAEQELTERRKREARAAELMADSKKAWAEGDVDGALRAADEALALVPGDAAVADRRARLARARDLIAESVRRARGLLDDGLTDKALAALDEAAKINERSKEVAALRRMAAEAAKNADAEADALLAEAKKRLEAGEPERAADALARLRKRPGLGVKREKLAEDYARTAEAALEKKRQADKNKARAESEKLTAGDAARKKAECDDQFRQAEAKRAAGDHAAAIRDYQKVLLACTDYCTAYNNIGASLYKLGYVGEALPWFEEAAKCDPSEKLFSENAGLTRKLADAKDKPKTGGAAERCAASFRKAEEAMAKKDHRTAAAGFRQVAETCPDNCAAFNNVGLSLNRLGYVKESLPWFEEALKCNPKDSLFKDNRDIAAKQLRAAKRETGARHP